MKNDTEKTKLWKVLKKYDFYYCEHGDETKDIIHENDLYDYVYQTEIDETREYREETNNYADECINAMFLANTRKEKYDAAVNLMNRDMNYNLIHTLSIAEWDEMLGDVIQERFDDIVFNEFKTDLTSDDLVDLMTNRDQVTKELYAFIKKTLYKSVCSAFKADFKKCDQAIIKANIKKQCNIKLDSYSIVKKYYNF